MELENQNFPPNLQTILINSPRRRACFNQCRLNQFNLTGDIFKGNCSCDSPIECRFGLPDYRTDQDEIGLMFPDKRTLYKHLWDGE